MDAIHALKSTLCYSSQPVSGYVLKEILKAAMHESARNGQARWQFVVINNRSILDEIPNFLSSARMLCQVPVAILICSDLHGGTGTDDWFRSCAEVSEKILMAVQAKGLGALRLSIYPVETRIEGMQKLIGLPEEVVPVSLIPLGYPLEGRVSSRRFDITRVHYNHW